MRGRASDKGFALLTFDVDPVVFAAVPNSAREEEVILVEVESEEVALVVVVGMTLVESRLVVGVVVASFVLVVVSLVAAEVAVETLVLEMIADVVVDLRTQAVEVCTYPVKHSAVNLLSFRPLYSRGDSLKLQVVAEMQILVEWAGSTFLQRVWLQM